MSETTIQPQMGLGFEQVWAALMETRASIQELRNENRETFKETDRRMKETERLLKESGAETDRLLKESGLKTDQRMEKLQQQVKYTNKYMGSLTNRFGELVEHLVAPNIIEKFNALDYKFSEIGRNCEFMNKDTDNVDAEVDILLENGKYSIAVEVKVKPDTKDVEDHIERLKFLRRFKDGKGDKREIRGAIASAIMPNEVKEMALQAGLYVIEQSGDTVKIETPQQVRGWRWLE
jgi:hypothetical protein